jgi:hypothetical protein
MQYHFSCWLQVTSSSQKKVNVHYGNRNEMHPKAKHFTMKRFILPAMLLFAVMGASAQDAKKTKPVKKAPPKVEVVKFTPPKVVKDEEVKAVTPPPPPKVKRPAKAKAKIAPPPPPPPKKG